MGYRLHVAKMYRVEYDYNGQFNHRTEDFENLLDLFEVERCNIGGNGEYSDMYEVEVDKFSNMISELRKICSEDHEVDEDFFEELILIIKNMCYIEDRRTFKSNPSKYINDVCDSLQYLLDHADTKSGYIVFSWF